MQYKNDISQLKTQLMELDHKHMDLFLELKKVKVQKESFENRIAELKEENSSLQKEIAL